MKETPRIYRVSDNTVKINGITLASPVAEITNTSSNNYLF